MPYAIYTYDVYITFIFIYIIYIYMYIYLYIHIHVCACVFGAQHQLKSIFITALHVSIHWIHLSTSPNIQLEPQKCDVKKTLSNMKLIVCDWDHPNHLEFPHGIISIHQYPSKNSIAAAFKSIHNRKTNMTMENPPKLKMYFCISY